MTLSTTDIGALATIIVDRDRQTITNTAIDALVAHQYLQIKGAADGDASDATGLIFQRAGTLGHVIKDAQAPVAVMPGETITYFKPLPTARLQELLSSCVEWKRFDNRKKELVECGAPPWLASTILSRDHWSDILVLQGIVQSPTLTPAGTLIQEPGYDNETGILFTPNCEFMPVNQAPTRDDARLACDMLLEVISDFPMRNNGDRSAWLASLLTPLARFRIPGPSPLNLISANSPGSGKSLLADVNSIIIAGRRMARTPWKRDNAETIKSLTGMFRAGCQMVLFDNIDSRLGNAALEAYLTSSTFQDRTLGSSEFKEYPGLTVLYATGNNIELEGDMFRRVLPIKLESKIEHPESRAANEFKHPDLLNWVTEHRPKLVHAALTILRGFIAAGSPKQEIRPWGGYEAWTNVISQTLIWAGMPDPTMNREELVEEANLGGTALREFLHWFRAVDPLHIGLTANEIVRHAENNDELRSLLDDLIPGSFGGLPTSSTLGTKLRSLRGRIAGGFYLTQASKKHGSVRWTVNQTTTGGQGGQGGVVAANGEYAFTADDLGSRPSAAATKPPKPSTPSLASAIVDSGTRVCFGGAFPRALNKYDLECGDEDEPNQPKRGFGYSSASERCVRCPCEYDCIEASAKRFGVTSPDRIDVSPEESPDGTSEVG